MTHQPYTKNGVTCCRKCEHFWPCADASTLPRVARPRGELSDGRADILREFRQRAEQAQEAYRNEVLAALAAGGSFSWVAEVTGLSTNTLQRWKREATTTAR